MFTTNYAFRSLSNWKDQVISALLENDYPQWDTDTLCCKSILKNWSNSNVLQQVCVCVSLCEYFHACVSPLMCACHSDKEVCRGLHHLCRHIPHLNVSRRERRYEMLRSLWVWIKTGVCMHVCVCICAPTCARMFKCAVIIHGMSPVYSVKWSSIETGEQVSPLPWQRADTSISRSLCSALLTCLSST